jgi:hypothetical protein
VAVEGSSNGVSGHVTQEASDAADRAAFLAGEDEKPAKVEADEESDVDEIEVDDDVDDEDLEAADEDTEEDLDDPDDKSPERTKLLDAARRREQRSRDALTKERKAFESERDAVIAEWKPKIEAAERFEALRARGVNAYNAVDVLLALGMSESEFEDGARAMFALSKTGAADPKNKELVARSKSERELRDEIRELKKWREDRETNEKQSAQEAAAAKAADRYLEGVVKSAPTGSLAAHFLEKEPEKTRARLGRIAIKLAERDGTTPTGKAVVAAYNKLRAKELTALGLDPSTFTKAGAKPKIETKTAPVNGKKTAVKKVVDEEKPLTRADFIAADFD